MNALSRRAGLCLALALMMTGCARTVSETPPVSPPSAAPRPVPQPAAPVAAAPQEGPETVIRSQSGGRFFRMAPVEYAMIPGWRADNQAEALPAFQAACGKMLLGAADESIGGDIGGTARDWSEACRAAAFTRPGDARAFFETHFQPVAIRTAPGDPALFTGYFEPELRGSRRPGGRYKFPVYAMPDLIPGDPAFARSAIDRGALAGQGLELAWVDDPVELFFLHIQGSGKIRLEDGSVMRVGYAGKNGHGYTSIGKVLVDWGEMTLDEVSAEGIKDWTRANPARMWELFATNPSYVFFTERTDLSPNEGPVGAMGLPLPTLRSIAVDDDVYPYGIPVWIETESPMGPLNRLVIAMDTGGAIKGAQRADIYYGSGAQAGRIAGATKHYGRMLALLPRAYVRRLLEIRT